MNLNFVWFENAEGKPDTMLSFAIVAFFIVCFKVLFGGMTFNIGIHAYTISQIDPSMVGALLTPTLGAYVIRRYTDKKFDTDGDGIADSDTPK
jgi:hypothetical protein